MFTLPEYCAPDFSAPLLQNAPSVRTAPAPADGAAPAGYHATGMYPEYYKVDGVWRLAEKSRMDCVPVLAPDGELRIVEFRNLVQGDSVVLEMCIRDRGKAVRRKALTNQTVTDSITIKLR